MSARGRIPQRVYPGGHIGPPLRNDWRYSGRTGNRCETEPFQRGGTEPAPYRRVEADQRRGEVTLPYGCNAGGAQQRANVPKAWLPPAKFRAEIWGVSHRHRPLRPAGDGTPGSSCPTGGCGEPPRLPWPAAHSGAFAPAGVRDGWELRQRSPPKCPATSNNPSVTAKPCQLLLYLRHGLRRPNAAGVWSAVTVPKILCSHTLTEF